MEKTVNNLEALARLLDTLLANAGSGQKPRLNSALSQDRIAENIDFTSKSIRSTIKDILGA